MAHSSHYRNHRTTWTISDLTFVEKHYRIMKTKLIAEYLGRSPISVRAAARSLGRSRKNSSPWTEAEKDIVRAHYAKGVRYVSALLPGRSSAMIGWIAQTLGVGSGRGWSREEEHILATFYPEQGAAVARQLPGRTPDAVKLKACDMGVKFLGGKKGPRMWSEDELMCLLKHDHLILPDLLKLFPERSRLSVKKARDRLRKKKAYPR